MSRLLRLTARLLVGLVIVVLGTELLLRAFDPLGILRYRADWGRYYAAALTADPARLYTMRPGQYQFSNWTATILPDGTRAVPDTNAAASCVVGLFGDSVAFGFGVSDADTFVNLLARQMPQARLINYGVGGYSISEIEATLRTARWDYGVYLVSNNDADQPLAIVPSEEPAPAPALTTYIVLLNTAASYAEVSVPDARFDSTLGYLRARGGLAVGFQDDGPLVAALNARLTLDLIPLYTHRISATDRHPNPEGHAEIAAQLLPRMAGFCRE